MDRTVFITSVPRKSAQNRHEYTSWNGRKMNVTKAVGAMRAGTDFSASASMTKSSLVTGFDKLVDNKWFFEKSKDVELPSEWQGSNIWQRKRISLQNFLELKHNVPKGTYTSQKPPFMPDNTFKPTYIQAFRYHLKDGTTVLNLDDPRDEIMHYLALASSKIANNKNEINMETDFYISYVNESQAEKATRNRKIRKANAKLTVIIDEKDPKLARKVATILKVIRGSVSNEAVENALYDFINSKEDQISNIGDFNEVIDLLDNKIGKERFETMYLLQELINNRIVTDIRGKYTWVQAPSDELSVIGKSKDSTINWLLDPDTAEWREMMEDQLEAKQ